MVSNAPIVAELNYMSRPNQNLLKKNRNYIIDSWRIRIETPLSAPESSTISRSVLTGD